MLSLIHISFESPSDTKGLEGTWSRFYTIIKAANLIIDNAGKAVTSQEEINIDVYKRQM